MNTSIHLAKRPTENIVPGETFRVQRTPIPKKVDVKENQALVRVEYLSVDPGFSNNMRIQAELSDERLAQ